MTRRIVLELADDTTETECGACPQIGEPRGHWCSVWGALATGRKRASECRAAESQAAHAASSGSISTIPFAHAIQVLREDVHRRFVWRHRMAHYDDLCWRRPAMSAAIRSSIAAIRLLAAKAGSPRREVSRG